MAAGATIERVNAAPAVRRAAKADAAALARLGLASPGDRQVFIAVRGDDPVAAVAVGARPFESEMLEREVCSIDEIATSDVGGAELAPVLSATCRTLEEEGCRLLTCRRPETDRATIAALQEASFRELERLVTLSRPLEEPMAMPAGVTLATQEDADGCAAVAGEIFTHDRFHADPNIPAAAADRLKAQWARNSVQGRADAVFVTRDKGKVTGFNACMRSGDAAVIDLIGVGAQYRGRGLGRALTLAAVAHYTGKAKEIRVGTQAINAPSLALYQATGFRGVSTAVTLHAHLS